MSIKDFPKWLLIAALLFISSFFTYALLDGRKVTFWPPAIAAAHDSDHAKKLSSTIDSLKEKISNLNKQLQEKSGLISESQAISKLPDSVQRQDLDQTAISIQKLIATIEQQDSELAKLHEKMQGIQGDFLFRLLSFHRDAGCFGDTLNFTYLTSDQDNIACTNKKELAQRFLGFLAEIEFFNGPVKSNPELAKKQLIKYQESKNFSRYGWYGRDVFKWIIIDYYEKA